MWTRPSRFVLISALIVLLLIIVAWALYVLMIFVACNEQGDCFT
jgi:hypothetical protein